MMRGRVYDVTPARGENRKSSALGRWKAILHVMTDGCDNASDEYSRHRYEELELRKPLDDIKSTFLYSFSSDFERSRALAEAICANGLIFVNTSREEQALDERDELIFTTLSQHCNKMAIGVRSNLSYTDFNYLRGDIPSHVGVEKFLKKIDIVFQAESFLTTPGLFVKHGNLMEENQIARQFLRAETRLEHLVDPLVVAQAMKLVLTHSQPLLPAPLLPLLFAAIPYKRQGEKPTQDNVVIQQVADILRSAEMTPRNLNCLAILLRVLDRVSDYSLANQATAAVLAEQFGPILLTSSSSSYFASSGHLTVAMHFFIANWGRLLPPASFD